MHETVSWPMVVETIVFFLFVAFVVWARSGYPKFWRK